MKKTRIVQAVLLLAVAAMIMSCGSGREYHTRSYPRSQTNLSLIIGSSPGLVVTRHPDGMYYYRDPRGFTYWRGYDNRYYLDRRYVNKSYHRNNQYNDWKRYNHGRRRR